MKRKKKKPQTTRHKPFMCLKCGAKLDALTEANAVVGDGTLPKKSVTICVYCGTVYSSDVDPEDLQRGVYGNWQVVPQDQVPQDLTNLAAQIRAAVKRTQN